MNQTRNQGIERYSAIEDPILSALGLKVSQKSLNSATALHWHEYFEIELIIKGRANYLQNDTKSILETESICLLTPIDCHKIEPIEPLEVINITLDYTWMPSEFLTAFMEKQQSHPKTLSTKTFTYLKSIFEKLYDEFSQSGPHRIFYMKNLVNCILSELTYIFTTSIGYATEQESETIKRALTYLYCNFRNSPSLHEVAEVAGLCDNYFSEVFRKNTGQTFNRFLNNLKLQHAYELLLHSKRSITEICFASGFNSMTHFQREFKNKYHCSPSEKRKI